MSAKTKMTKKQKLVRLIELRVQTAYAIDDLVGISLNNFDESRIETSLRWYKENYPDLTEYDNFNFVK